MKLNQQMKTLLPLAAIAGLAVSANAAVTILSSEDWEGATSSSDFANTNYDWAVEGFIFDGPGASTNTTQTGFFRSSNRLYTLKDPLLLASGGYTSMTVAQDFYYDYSHSNRIYGAQLEYSANGLFTDTQVVKKWVSEDYTINEWHSVSEILDPGTYSFTDTAKIRIRSGGWANSTHSWHDNIVISGEGPAAIPEPSSTALLGLGGLALLLRRRR